MNNPDDLKKELGLRMYQNKIDCINYALNEVGREYVEQQHWSRDWDWDENIGSAGNIYITRLRHKEKG